jgi:hypothetical protein
MTARRVAMLAAAVAVVAWAAKAIAIWIAGGLDRSALEGPLFLAGFLSLLAAVAAVGVALAAGRATWLRVVAALALLGTALWYRNQRRPATVPD